jgi:hypothetical protein
MKKQLLFIIILIGHTFPTFSQEYQYVPFPDSGAIWSEVYYPETDGNVPSSESIFERFALSGEDTIMNEKLYKKLFIFYDSVFNKNKASCVGGIREDSLKRIYYCGSIIHDCKPMVTEYSEILLYDFSLNLGDSLGEKEQISLMAFGLKRLILFRSELVCGKKLFSSIHSANGSKELEI